MYVWCMQALRPGSHTDAVLSLAWNPAAPSVLASASADATAKIWDLNTAQCQATLTHHSDKVQALAWNPAEAAVLLTAAFDRTAALVSFLILYLTNICPIPFQCRDSTTGQMHLLLDVVPWD